MTHKHLDTEGLYIFLAAAISYRPYVLSCLRHTHLATSRICLAPLRITRLRTGSVHKAPNSEARLLF